MAYIVSYGTLRTGLITSTLPVVSCTVGDDLRGVGSFSATVGAGQAEGGTLWDITRGATSMYAVEWASDFGRQIVAAGPIFARSGDDDGITYGGSNLFGMLAHRRLLDPSWSDAQIAKLSLTYAGLDLGSIMAAIVAKVCTVPPADLPIVYQPPRAGANTRTYFGYDVASTADRVSELGSVEEGTYGLGGPDWILTPRFGDDLTATVDFTRVEWVLRTGTATAPSLMQVNPLVLDRTPPRQQDIGPLSVSEDAANLATHAFTVGSGTEAAKMIASSFDSTLTDRGYPRMDVTDTSNALDYATVKAQSSRLLTSQKRTPSATTVTVRAALWWANGFGLGTTVRLIDPTHPVFGPVDLTSRVLKWSADVASDWVTLTLADSLTEV